MTLGMDFQFVITYLDMHWEQNTYLENTLIFVIYQGQQQKSTNIWLMALKTHQFFCWLNLYNTA